MPFSFPDSYIPTVTKIIIDINSGNKLLEHQLGASPRAGKVSKITQYHDCILKGKYIKSRSQLTKRLLTCQLQPSVLYKLLQAPRTSLLFRGSQTSRHRFFLFLEYTQSTSPWFICATPEPVNPSALYCIYSNHQSISKEHTPFLTPPTITWRHNKLNKERDLGMFCALLNSQHLKWCLDRVDAQ